MAQSDYEFAVSDDFILIRDMNLGNMSVTNNIETVVREVAAIVHKVEGKPLRCFRLLYMDSERMVDGILTTDNRFDSFYHLGCKDFNEAKSKARGMIVDNRGKLLG
jgi:hypothetical protein